MSTGADGGMSLKAVVNGNYGGPTAGFPARLPLVNNRTAAGAWETFFLVS